MSFETRGRDGCDQLVL